jgi:hypothetical protein
MLVFSAATAPVVGLAVSDWANKKPMEFHFCFFRCDFVSFAFFR